MKSIFKVLLFLALIYGGYFFFTKYGSSYVELVKSKIDKSLCEKPVTYKIGLVDDGFDISEEDLMKKIEEASKVWETAYGNPLFVYNPESKLDINLIYDERQENLVALGEIEGDVYDKKLSLEEENKIYEQKVADLEAQIADLSEQIDYWNSRGGAPEPEYKALTKLQEDLNRKVEEVNSYAENLNTAVDTVNENIDNLNTAVSKFNSLISEKPEIGFYASGEEKIDVYFYADEKYLVNVLAHEMGHSLGLDHIDADGAIMNPVVSENTRLTQPDIDLVKNFCNENTVINVTKNKIKFYIDLLFSKVLSITN